MAYALKALLVAVATAAALPAFAQSAYQQQPGNFLSPQGTDQGMATPGAPSNPVPIFNRSRTLGPAGTPLPSVRPGGTLNESGQAQPQVAPDYKDRLEFQDFVLQTTGRDLPVFGTNLFRGAPSTFAPVDNVPVTPDYVIGPGDEIMLRVWGQIDIDYSMIVDRNGTISIPRVGVVNVAGIKYQDLTPFLKTVLGRVFKNFELTATLGQLRSIQIFVVGQARRPGTYTVSSLSSLVTALFAVGGPSSKGSMRGIQLKRGNAVVTELDLYELLVFGNKSRDAALLPGDVIYIPPVGDLVAVAGSVNVPAIYELKQSAPLSEVLRWAGGLATTAQGQKVTVERIDQRKVRTIEELSLDKEGLARGVRDGDLVTVYALTPRFDNAITLRGNVAQPGRIPWRTGMRIKDLIPSREALISRDYWLTQSQLVGMDPNVARIMQDQDTTGTRLAVTDLIERQLREDEDVPIGEAIRRRQIERAAGRLVDGDLYRPEFSRSDPNRADPGRPGEAGSANRSMAEQQQQSPAPRVSRDRRPLEPGTDRTRLLNQITPSLKEVNWEYAVIERLNQSDLTTALVPFNLGRAVIQGDPQHNLLLLPGDVVTIFSREDLQVSLSKQTRFVRLEGELASPGVYQVQPGETLRQLVVRIGGLAPNAYLFGSEFTRESTRIQQQKNLTEALNRLEQDIQRSYVTRAQNANEDAGSIRQQVDSQQTLLARLRQVRTTGRIVLEIPEQGQTKDLPDLPLEDGDRFFVPSIPSMVSVFGSVFNESSFIYKPEKRMSDYLAQAGGPTRVADKNSIYLLRADGSVVSKRQGGFLSSGLENSRLMPGDSVVVPEDFERVTTFRMLKDISQILYQFGLGAAALKVLRN